MCEIFLLMNKKSQTHKETVFPKLKPTHPLMHKYTYNEKLNGQSFLTNQDPHDLKTNAPQNEHTATLQSRSRSTYSRP